MPGYWAVFFKRKFTFQLKSITLLLNTTNEICRLKCTPCQIASYKFEKKYIYNNVFARQPEWFCVFISRGVSLIEWF